MDEHVRRAQALADLLQADPGDGRRWAYHLHLAGEALLALGPPQGDEALPYMRVRAALSSTFWAEDAARDPLARAELLELLQPLLAGTAPVPEGLDEEGAMVLRYLVRWRPCLQTLAMLEAALPLARRTIGHRVAWLVDQDWACRPRGGNRGATATFAGAQLAERLPPHYGPLPPNFGS